MDSPIKPSVGRVVLVHGGSISEDNRVVPALIQRVWSNNTVNLAAMTDYGCKIFTSVQYSEEYSKTHMNWFWMPYQVQQAATQKEI